MPDVTMYLPKEETRIKQRTLVVNEGNATNGSQNKHSEILHGCMIFGDTYIQTKSISA